MKKALFVVLDDYADWEGAYLASQLNKNENWNVKTVSTQNKVTSIGGFTTLVDYKVDELSTDFDLLILIGGNSWNINNTDLFDLVNSSLHKGIPVGAICGAVDFLAKNGFLDNYKHTGNAQILWQDYSKYTNPKGFLEQQAVKDRNLVTANGTAPLAFTKLVMEMIHFDNDKNINKLVDLYQIGFYEYCKKYGNPYNKG